jgi:hypothetical protein
VYYYYCCYYYYLTAIEFSLGGSGPYTSTDKTNKNMYKRNNTKHSTNNIQHSKYKYTYYQNTYTIVKTPALYKTPAHTQTLPKRAKAATVQNTQHRK